MQRVLTYIKHLFRREPEYRFVSLSLDQTLTAALLPYRSPQAATYWQIAHLLYEREYWKPENRPTDSLTVWYWLDAHTFSPDRIARKDYPS